MPNKHTPEENIEIDMPLDTEVERRSLDELENAMKEMPEDMRSFSRCLRELYVGKAVGTNEEAAVKFRKIRDDTKNDAVIYLEHVLPVSTELISSIDEFFDYVIELDASAWHSSISSIKETVKYSETVCKTVQMLHKDIIATLEKREKEVISVMKELQSLQETLSKKKESLEKRSKMKHIWAWGFVLGENSHMAAQMFASSDKDMVKAIACGAQVQTQQDAAEAVTKNLIPALKSFINGLEKVTNFFWDLKKDGVSNFNMDKQRASQIKRYCNKFIRCIPSVKTDLHAIPTEGTDQNYIDRWLEKQKRAINASCTPTFAKNIITLITGGSKPKPKALKNAAESSSATSNQDPHCEPKCHLETTL